MEFALQNDGTPTYILQNKSSGKTSKLGLELKRQKITAK
jgi:hypothetical protein